MKRMLIVGLAVVFSLLAQTALASEYTVRKGDSLCKIGKLSSVPWRQIAEVNNIKPPYTIYVGQKLKVASSAERKTAAPSQAQPKSEYQKKIESLEAQAQALENKIKEAAALKAKAEKEKALAREAAPASSGARAVGQKTVVGSPAVREAVKTETTSAKVEVPAATSYIDAKVIGGTSDNFDAILNFGHYQAINGASSSGNYLNGRLRGRFLHYDNINDDGLDVGLGLFGYGSMTDGEYGKNKDAYHKRAWTIGPTGKFYGNGWDLNIDMGFGQVREYGKGYDETQTVFAPFLWFSNYARRSDDNPWFTKTEVGLGLVIPFPDQGKRNMQTGELYFTQWIYDWKLSRDVRLSAGLEAGLGYDRGGSGYNFWRLGPALSLEYKNQSVVALSTGYKDKINTDGDLWLVNVSLNVGNVIKLIAASGITEPTAADLRLK